MLKQNKGITLVALVITIIVLIILAGVTIATLSGPNGILTNANTATQKTSDAEKVEKINVALAGAQTSLYTGKDIGNATTDTSATDTVIGKIREELGNDYTVAMNGTTLEVSATLSDTTKKVTGTLTTDKAPYNMVKASTDTATNVTP